MNPFEALGRATLRAETAEKKVNQLAGLLKALKEGKITLDAIRVTDTDKEQASADAGDSDDNNPGE